MPTLSVETTDSDGQSGSIRLYYEERGVGDPILCIHGSLSSAKMWAESAEELAQVGRVITYDRRGCTRSERPEPNFTSVSQHSDDAAALLDALAATPAIVIGRSYGGEVATDLALRYPHHVRALVLLEGATANLTAGARQWMAELTERISSAATAGGTDMVAEIVVRDALGDAAWEAFPDEVKAMFAANGPAVLAEIQGGELEVDAAALAAITQPTLLVAASDSIEPLRETTYALAEALPNARTVLVPGGHMINPAEPAVLDFIRPNHRQRRASTNPPIEPGRVCEEAPTRPLSR
jgi:pimeloyl-ACP methyl ester carboxylesterase